MRTTLAIDDDLYQRLQDEMQKRGCSFRDVVNASLRRGLEALSHPARPEPFVVKPFPGGPAPGVNWDCTGQLLDEIEGPFWR